MNKTQKALKLAIEQMQHLIKIYIPSPEWSGTAIQEDCYETIQACKEALAQPTQEPVAVIQQWEHKDGDKWIANELPWDEMPPVGTKLFTHPAPAIEQEPVAWIEVTTHHEKYQTSKVILLDKGIKLPHDTPLYTHPVPPCQECENLKHDLEGYMDANKALINREWQGLSISEEDGFIVRVYDANTDEAAHQVVLDIEQALKEKNEK